MKTSAVSKWLLCLGLVLSVQSVMGIDPKDTRLLSQPAISSTHIAFIYAEDLWVANRDGSNPRRLTIDEGVESGPVFSPDGSMIVFNAQYDGNTDVFIVPVEGGVPKRLTWHPYGDRVYDFSPDGTKVLFGSQRNTFTNRFNQLFSVDIASGSVAQLPVPTAFSGSYSDDGSHIAYSPNYEAFNQWKHYRGGTIYRIWLYNTSDHKVTEIPQANGGSNDAHPNWMGDLVYFKSDRNGEFNLFSYNVKTKEVRQLTSYTDFPVLNLSAADGKVIFEQAGYLHIYDSNSGNTSKLSVGIATDLLELRTRYVSGNRYIRNGSISPSGARVVVDFRGDIVTVPAEKGDPKNLTSTPGVHEQDPMWSPDGKSIAYFSDSSGEYALHIRAQNGNGGVNVIPLNGTGFYSNLHWSPDSKKLCYVDNGRNLYVLNIASKGIKKIASDEMYIPGAFRELFGDWSFDSKWVAYTVITDTNFERVFLYSLDQGKSFPISDGLSNVTDPVFDPSGKYLYMLASTDAGPVLNWFDQSNQDMQTSNSIYLVTLQESTLSPLAKENDQEEIETPKAEEDNKGKKGKPQSSEKTLKIDWNGIENRIIDLPIPPAMHSNLGIAKEGELFYLKFAPNFNGPTSLHKFDLKEKESKKIMDADAYMIAAKGDKMLYLKNRKLGITATGKKPDNGFLKTEDIQIKIDPKAEWANIFDEAWRVNRDYFYDPGMHGADWDAMKVKYQSFVPHVSCRSDLYRVMQWMFSELAVGHHRFFNRGDRLNTPQRINGGLLGADYEVSNNRYRITKIYGGLNWNPELRSPLTEPGVNVKVGDYILAVNGKEVTAEDNFFSFFENTAGKIISLSVGPTTESAKARTVKVTPVNSERALRNRDWVEGNLKKVHEATDGQVAYVYVPNTAFRGHTYFKRYFYPQATKKAIIIDERFNGGGQIADYYIDMLKKPEQSYWNFRYGKDLKSPSASIQGPKVMLIDETAGSGGDLLPWLFRKFEVGTLIGKRTWGGLVGILGYPEFIDGGGVTAPNVAFYTSDGFRVENEGVAPDIEIEQWPEEVINGRDPQLEKAIEVILQQLKDNPPKKTERPPYPVRTKN